MRARSALPCPSFVILAVALLGCGPVAQTAQGEQAATARWQPAPVREGNLRVATFNIRNFPQMPLDPEAEPPADPPSYQRRSDEQAVLGVLAALDFDLLAVQEIIDTELFEALVARLGEQTGRRYAAVLSRNDNGNPQHVGFVYDAGVLSLDELAEHPEVDVRGTLRPGLSARVASTAEGGVDFGVMVLHLASGTSHKRAALRAEQGAAAAAIAAGEMVAAGDDDFIVLGDLNTAREEEELGGLDAVFAQAAAFSRQNNASGCSTYWVKSSHNPTVRPSWIDHVYLSALSERDAEVALWSGAHCAERLCQPFESTDAASGSSFWSVSDHCPVYFEIADVDED